MLDANGALPAWAHRDVVIRIDASEFLQYFVRLGCQLIEKVLWIHRVGREVLPQMSRAGNDAPELAYYLPLVEKIIDQAHKRILQGQKVPADEKLYSLFEAHTEII